MACFSVAPFASPGNTAAPRNTAEGRVRQLSVGSAVLAGLLGGTDTSSADGGCGSSAHLTHVPLFSKHQASHLSSRNACANFFSRQFCIGDSLPAGSASTERVPRTLATKLPRMWGIAERNAIRRVKPPARYRGHGSFYQLWSVLPSSCLPVHGFVALSNPRRSVFRHGGCLRGAAATSRSLSNRTSSDAYAALACERTQPNLPRLQPRLCQRGSSRAGPCGGAPMAKRDG